MDAISCIKERRSIRKFKDQAIDPEVIKSVVETASYAPSWKNSQITRYYAVTGEKKNLIGANCTSVYPHNGEIMAQAPMLMVICAKNGRSGYERDGSFTTTKGDHWQNFDCGIATEAFCLAAHEAGLGTVIMGIFDEFEVAKLIELPEDMQVMALVPIGYPDEAPAAPKRKGVDELLTFLN